MSKTRHADSTTKQMTNLYVWASRCHLDVQVHTPITKMITRDAKWSLRTLKQVVLVCQPKPFQQGGSQQLPVDGGPMAGGEHIYVYIYTYIPRSRISEDIYLALAPFELTSGPNLDLAEVYLAATGS